MESKKVKEAINIVILALKTDKDYRETWKSNITMSFIDEWDKNQCKMLTYPEARIKIAEDAAENFLNLLCMDDKNA